MTAEKILLILCIIAFAIGALVPVFATGAGPGSINWLCLGLAFAAAAWYTRLS